MVNHGKPIPVDKGINMELTQNLWERYGFTGNPFDTRALSLSSEAPLSIKNAYLERPADVDADNLMTNFLRNPGGGRILVEGNAGVGKTTFVNRHRYRWEKTVKHKLSRLIFNETGVSP